MADESLVDRVAQRAHLHTGRGQGPQHALQPRRPLVPPVAEQFGVEGGDHVSGPSDALRLGEQPIAHHVDEVGDVAVDRVVGAVGIVGRLGLRRHIAAGYPGRLEPGQVVVGVEIAIGGMPGVARLGRPHPVADLQVAPERDHVGVADRPAQRGVAVQRRAVDHEMCDPRGGVVVFHTRGVGAFGRPDPGRALRELVLCVGQAFA